jgi:transposase
LAEEGGDAFPGHGRQTPEQEEIRRLKRKVEILTQERDILKKAIAIFSEQKR